MFGQAGGHPRPLPRLGEDREQDRGQNGNDGNHHEKLDQGEPLASASILWVSSYGALGTCPAVPPRAADSPAWHNAQQGVGDDHALTLS